MTESKKARAGEKNAGLPKRASSKVFKGNRSAPKDSEKSLIRRQAYDVLDCISTLGTRQEKGWDGEKMSHLLRLDDQKKIFGREGSTSFYCNSEDAPVLSLEASPDPSDWPKDMSTWSVSLFESNTSLYVTFVDLDHEVDGLPSPIIVRAQIGGMHSDHGWAEFERLLNDAVTAYEEGVENKKPFDAVVNDCGSIRYVILKG